VAVWNKAPMSPLAPSPIAKSGGLTLSVSSSSFSPKTSARHARACREGGPVPKSCSRSPGSHGLVRQEGHWPLTRGSSSGLRRPRVFVSKRGSVLNRTFPVICIKWRSEGEELFPRPERAPGRGPRCLSQQDPATEAEQQGPSLHSVRDNLFFPANKGLYQLLGCEWVGNNKHPQTFSSLLYQLEAFCV